jgi:thioredoxin reductase (NADPH)
VTIRPETECIIVGGGPAGLTAALYLARFRRRVIVFDAGGGRATLIPRTRNLAGFPAGISGIAFLRRLRQQAERYGARVVETRVDRVGRDEAGTFIVEADGARMSAPRLFLATGIVDVDPPVRGIKSAVRRGIVRYCPICDAFEASGQRVAVIGPAEHARGKALFLRAYTPDVIVAGMPGHDMALDEGAAAELDAAGITVEPAPITGIALAGEHPRLRLGDGRDIDVDMIYPALGAVANTGLAADLGVTLTAEGGLRTDRHGLTDVPGLYAAGDVVEALHQIAVAAAQAAAAATAIHNSLPHRWPDAGDTRVSPPARPSRPPAVRASSRAAGSRPGSGPSPAGSAD